MQYRILMAYMGWTQAGPSLQVHDVYTLDCPSLSLSDAFTLTHSFRSLLIVLELYFTLRLPETYHTVKLASLWTCLFFLAAIFVCGKMDITLTVAQACQVRLYSSPSSNPSVKWFFWAHDTSFGTQRTKENVPVWYLPNRVQSKPTPSRFLWAWFGWLVRNGEGKQTWPAWHHLYHRCWLNASSFWWV